MTVFLKKTDYDRITAHARAGLPNEACGLIAGKTEGDQTIIEKVYLLANVDKSPEHFSIDPKEQLTAVRDMRTLGFVPLGNFHSHPSTPARLSKEDIRLAFDPKALYLVVSLAKETAVLKAFSVEHGTTRDLPLELV
ncbi:Mov34/MPN/PAD-1 family protein [Spirochaetia bacterium]|nr:Mov34/MPN/PAD-1 family protein [Spirochaetia bacterium]